MFKLKNKSIIARFFKWIWHVEPTDYKSMCPYFWQYLGTIIILPLILVWKLVTYLLSFLPAKKKRQQAINWVANSKFGDGCEVMAEFIVEKPSFWRGVGGCLKWIYILIMCIMVLFGVGALVWEFIQDPWKCFAILGMILTGIGALIGVIALFTTTNIGKVLWSPFRLFGIMVSSLYNNWCPRIEWVD